MDYYSEIAEGYEELHGEEQDEKIREFLGKVELDDRSSLLDVGCGTGRSFQLLGLDHWYGIDPAEKLIAKSLVKERITKGVAEELPYPDGSFDVVFSLTALQNFSNPKKGLEEIKRVCKPKGTILLSFLKKSKERATYERLIENIFTIEDSWENSKDMMYVCST